MTEEEFDKVTGVAEIRESGKGNANLEHYEKVQRGELPKPTKDGFTWYHRGFSDAVQNYSLTPHGPLVFALVSLNDVWYLATACGNPLKKIADAMSFEDVVAIANPLVLKSLLSIDLEADDSATIIESVHTVEV